MNTYSRCLNSVRSMMLSVCWLRTISSQSVSYSSLLCGGACEFVGGLSSLEVLGLFSYLCTVSTEEFASLSVSLFL